MTVIEAPTGPGASRFTVEGPLGASVLVVLGHGAGGGIDAPDLVALAAQLPSLGPIAVARYEQPWRVAGRKVAPAPARLDEAWVEALPVLLGRCQPSRLVLGGRSAGARVACRTAAPAGADAVLALSFPLHAPGRPEKSRADELLGVGLPTLVVQGSRDPFGGTDELRSTVAGREGFEVIGVEDAVHDLTLPKRARWTTDELWSDLAGRIAFWVGTPA